MNIYIKKILKGCIPVFLLCGLIASCASQGIKSIEPEERDRSGKFDGTWVASANIKRHMTRISNIRLTCYEDSFSLTIRITDGSISTPRSNNGVGYIKEDGTFYFNWEIENTKKAYMGANRRLIISGSLGDLEGEGTVVVTFDHPTQGCKGTVTLKKGSMEESAQGLEGIRFDQEVENQILNKDLPIMVGEDSRLDNISISHTSKEYNIDMTFLSNALQEAIETSILAFGQDNVDSQLKEAACNSLGDRRAFIEGYAINVVIRDKTNKILSEFICDKL